jgi:hypothetical protein
MKRSIPILTLIAFLGGLGAAYAGGGGASADRLRDPNGRGMGMSVSQYNKNDEAAPRQRIAARPERPDALASRWRIAAVLAGARHPCCASLR